MQMVSFAHRQLAVSIPAVLKDDKHQGILMYAVRLILDGAGNTQLSHQHLKRLGLMGESPVPLGTDIALLGSPMPRSPVPRSPTMAIGMPRTPTMAAAPTALRRAGSQRKMSEDSFSRVTSEQSDRCDR